MGPKPNPQTLTVKKHTKIIATLGPVSESEDCITKLIENGVNVFRFNLKHNTLSWHEEKIKLVKDIAKKLNAPIGILIDLQGPEIRINLPKETLSVTMGEKILLSKTETENDKSFYISHPQALDYLEVGNNIVIDDGYFTFTVFQKTEDGFLLESHSAGTIKNRKTMNIPGTYFPLPVISQRELDAIEMGKRAKVDFVALSFVRKPHDIEELKEALSKINFETKVVAKIETKMAIEHLDEIIEISDSIMVARGDLGIEIPMEQVPHFQKQIIKKCIHKGIPVITATQMLESMIKNPHPTRAEVSDVANAVYDFTDAVMLSGETAYGAYPELSVTYMAKTIHYTESNRSEDTRLLFSFPQHTQTEMICDTAYNLYIQLAKKSMKVCGFIVFTKTGNTSRILSRYRPNVPVFAFTPQLHTVRSLTLNYGIIPIEHKAIPEGTEVAKSEVKEILAKLIEQNYVKQNEIFITIHGDKWGEENGTSTIRIVRA